MIYLPGHYLDRLQFFFEKLFKRHHQDRRKKIPLGYAHLSRYFGPNQKRPSSYTLLKYFKKISDVPQEIYPADHHAQKLIKYSTLDKYPHEVLQIFLKDHNQVLHEGPIIHGTRKKISEFKFLQKKINELLSHFQKRGYPIQEVILSHTHPTPEFIVLNKEKTHFSMRPLSASDLKMGKRLCQMFQIKILLKATTSGLITYQQHFHPQKNKSS